MHGFSLDRTIFVLICFVMIWWPIPLGSNRPWAWSLLQLLICAGFVLHLINVWQLAYRHGKAINGHRIEIVPSHIYPVLAPILALQAYLGLQLSGLVPQITTVDPVQTEVSLYKGLCLAAFVVLLGSYVQRNSRMRHLILAIVFSGLFQACYGAFTNLANIEYSLFFNIFENDRARGSFAYQNFFANYMALCLSLGFGLLLSELAIEKGRWSWKDMLATLLTNKFMLRLALIVMVIGLVLSRSRMGNAAFFAALAVIALFAVFFYKDPPRMLKPIVISLFVLDMLIIGSIFGLEKLQQRYAETSFASEARDNVVVDSLPILHDYGLTGAGSGSFYTVFPGYQPGYYSGFYDHAHNDYLQFAIEIGIPMTLLLFGFMLWLFYMCLRVMMVSRDRLHRGIAFGCAMAMLHMGIHCVVDFNLQSFGIALQFCTILALASMVYAKRHQVRQLKTM